MVTQNKVLFLGFVLSFFLTQEALSCASCGSGSDEPLILYPNEAYKLYFGVSRSSGFANTDQNGFISNGVALRRKTQFYLSSGMSVNERSFVTLGLPFFANSGLQDTRYGLGDPVLSARYTLVPLNFANEFIPQIQVLASLKPALSRSIHESVHEEELDVFGSGFHQVRAGLDLWFGLTALQFGMAQMVGYSLPKTANDHHLQPGLEFRSILSMGHTFEGIGKLVFGGSHLSVSESRDQGKRVANSAQVNNSLFLSTDYFVDQVSTVRLTVARQAALLRNRNTTRVDSVAVAYLRSF